MRFIYVPNSILPHPRFLPLFSWTSRVEISLHREGQEVVRVELNILLLSKDRGLPRRKITVAMVLLHRHTVTCSITRRDWYHKSGYPLGITKY